MTGHSTRFALFCHCERSEAISVGMHLRTENASTFALTRFGGLETRP